MLPFKDIIDALVPYMSSVDDRRTLVETALYGCPVLNQIKWEGAAQTFTALLVRKLIDYGECEAGTPSIIAIIEALKGQVGSNKHAELDALIAAIGQQEAPTIDTSKLPDVENKDLYIFISYARPQQALAEQVEIALRGAGLKVFRDTSDIRSGADWDMTIEKALTEADRMVLLLSSASMPYRKEVHREWFFFDQERKPIYPLYVEDCKLHSRLYAYNYIDARRDLQAALAKLLQELGKDYTPPGELVSADRIVVVPEAESRTLPEAFSALLATIRDPKGSIALTPDLTQSIVKHPPADMTEYQLGRIAEWSQPRYQLDNRFVNLTLLLDKGEDAQVRWERPDYQFKDLRDVLREQADTPAFVLLGAPGSGKSTLLRRLQLDMAMSHLQGDDQPLCFFIQLNAYHLNSPQPLEWIAAIWNSRYSDLPPLEDLLKNGQMLLLLDAVNEMPHRNTQDYHERVARWRMFTQDVVRQGNRVIFSCRTLDYSASLSSKDLRVPHIAVQPMSREQVEQFLHAYTPEHAAMIWQELDGSPQFDIFRTPYFLKLLVEQVEDSREIPTGRASLFTGFVRQALKREIAGGNALFLPDTLLNERDLTRLNQNKWRNPTDLPERGVLIPKLCQLAFEMQEKGLETESASVRVDIDDACNLIDHERDEDILKAGVALNVLDEDISQLEILFFHQLLQEFFAARELATNPDPERVQVAWHKDEVSPSLDDVLATLADSDPLPALPQTGWEETTLLAAAMSQKTDGFIREIQKVNLPLAGRCAAMPDVKVSDTLKRELQDALIERTQNMDADLRARIAAGLALGELGDPRFERKTGKHGDYLLPPLVTIPAGIYTIGLDNAPYDREEPAHPVELGAFQIGQFPVTNAEYALFIEAGGYEDEQWWEDTEEALAWLRGEGSTDGQKQQWRENKQTFESWPDTHFDNLVQQNRITSEQADQWRAIRDLAEDEFERQLEDAFPSGKTYREPAFWNDSNFNNPNQPVVGITWFEARAYCKWLSEQTGQSYELPTEAQWEAAARGQHGWIYPYGNEFDVTQGNTFESHIRRSTPIGIYRGTPEKLFDLSGNVYDWTLSIYDEEQFPYPYNAGDGRNAIEQTNARRVLRGGGWNHDLNVARAVFRFLIPPSNRFSSRGFRLCVPLLG